MKSLSFSKFILGSIMLLYISCSSENRDQSEFDRYKYLNWKLAFVDKFDSKIDTATWMLDGMNGNVMVSSLGMKLCAGGRAYNDSDHVVLWIKRKFKGSLKIEYDFTRLDTTKEECVNILYIHANGSNKGVYKEDIGEWGELRKIPAMDVYFNHMNAYHISYAVVGPDSVTKDYIRARRYLPETGRGLKGTALEPEYLNTGLFQTGVRHHITVILHENKLFMEVSNKDGNRLFWFDISSHPYIREGYIGLRQMWTRCSRYENFEVSELER
ncbi:DUF1961 family protein [Dysgonomonas sp. OttesenSCG-928-M03]|nr:DUF1961 family protein [Dysgonomonas sp. OttesenSCG-928-M03]